MCFERIQRYHHLTMHRQYHDCKPLAAEDGRADGTGGLLDDSDVQKFVTTATDEKTRPWGQTLILDNEPTRLSKKPLKKEVSITDRFKSLFK